MSRSKLTRGDRRAVRLACLMLASLPLAAWLTAPAKADPETVESYAFRNATAICAMLGNDDSDAGITNVAARLFNVGVQPFQAGEVMYLAVHNICPGFEPELLAWAHKVAPPVSQTYRA